MTGQQKARETAAPIVVLVPDERGMTALAGLPDVRPVGYDAGTPRLPDRATDAEILVARQLDPTPRLFDQLPRLRMVQLFSSGSERWETAVPDGVRVSNAAGVHGATVAEWVVAQLLCHVRNLATYRVQQAQREWQAHRTSTLAGARVLVFGAGDIGVNLRRLLEPFGCDVTLAGRTARTGVVSATEAIAALGDQDVVVLALPLSDSTFQLVDGRFLAALRDGAVLVNVGRGGLVDTAALLAATGTGRIHAILDVTDPEPLPADHPLWTVPGVVVSPHAAGITDDVLDRCWTAVTRNVAAYARTRMQSPRIQSPRVQSR